MGRTRRSGVGAAAVAIWLAFMSAGLLAQGTSSFLFVDQERLLTGSRAGQALLAREDAARRELTATARSLDTAFESEELALTQKRKDLEPAEFRKLAEEFDAKVIAARSEQDARSAELALEFENERRKFYSQVAPLLVEIMQSHGALAVFDEKTILLADRSVNITDDVIREIDARFEDEGRIPAAPE